METILHKDKIIALKISSHSMGEGVQPLNSPEDALQVLTHKRAKGSVVVPHAHAPHKRETHTLQEFLVVLRGKIRISFFDEGDNTMHTYIDLSQGEACITLHGPHGVEFLEDSEVIEIKNGPYFDDKKLLPVL